MPGAGTTAHAGNRSAPRPLILAAIGVVGFGCVITQLTLMREMLGAFSGNEVVLGILLGAWLLLTGLGAALGRTAQRVPGPGVLLVVGLLLLGVLPLGQTFLLRVARDAVFGRGQMIGPVETAACCLLLLLPFCVVSGYLLPLACTLLGPDPRRAGIGWVYIADGIGSVLGGALFSFALIRWFDHFTILYLSALPALFLAGLLAWSGGNRWWLATATATGAALLALAALTDLEKLATSRQYPGQKIAFSGESPYGRLVVADLAGQWCFVANGLPILFTGDIGQAEETVHFALAQRPEARRVLLVGGGFSGTIAEVLKYPVREVTYVELDPLIVRLGRRFVPQCLDDPRVHVLNTDGRLFIRGIRHTATRYDAIILDVPPPATARDNRFYTLEFLAEAKEALTPGGVICLPLGRYENYLSPELGEMLATAGHTLQQCFRNLRLLPGATHVFFLASDDPLYGDLAERLASRHIPTRLLTRHYLDATLTADRSADVNRALARPAAVNRDFTPVLYYYHLRYWISQFKVRFGLLEALLLAGLVVYLVRLRAVPLVLFGAGFAASALEVVLLLGYQTLFGSLYARLGAIVTIFMAGLTLGALVTSRWSIRAGRRSLAGLALGLAIFAALLPVCLRALGGSAVSPALAQAAIGLLTLVLAGVVGAQFPVAGRLDAAEAGQAGSRLYTADFTGACLGALLTSTLLIPLLGVSLACLATGALNLAAGLGLGLRKSPI